MCIDLDWFFCSLAVIDSLFNTAPIVLWVFCVLYLFCCAVLSVLTDQFCNHLPGEERAGCFTLLPFNVM